MKKYLLSALLIIMISLIGAQSHFFDMRVGDFGCITRVVFEFTGKVNYKVQEENNKLSISLSLLSEGKIQLPIEESSNITNINLAQGDKSATLNLDFIYPIEVTSYAYFEQNKNYIIVFDIYDKAYLNNKEKGLATLLFKGQKFSLSNIISDIDNFSNKYPNDPLVNMYLGRLYARHKEMKNTAISYFKKIEPSSNYYFTAQAYIGNLTKNKFPEGEVKPDFLEKETSETLDKVAYNDTLTVVDVEDQDKMKAKAVTEQDATEKTRDNNSRIGRNMNKQKSIDSDKESDEESNSFWHFLDIVWYVLFAIALIWSIILIMKSIKKDIIIKELKAKLEGKEFELKALANKLEKGIIENSKTKDRMIIKLYNNGWKPEAIADELNTSLEIVQATISKEGRL